MKDSNIFKSEAKTKKRILASVSGGETSMFMSKWLKENMSQTHDIIYVFANTGQEHENTLLFVDQCDKEFDLGIVWVEAVINPERGKGIRHNIVDYESADRVGVVFEAQIKKYGIPCVAGAHCTRDLKANTIISFARSIGWKAGTYDLAIGIRVDEIDRINSNRKKLRLFYPFCEVEPITKQDVNIFWRDMPFRLQLKGYEGNCLTCFKKSNRKLATIALERPEWFDFFRDMENKYQYEDPRTGERPNEPYRFFRNKMSVDDIFELTKDPTFRPATDDHILYHKQFTIDWDISNGCEESCEVFT